MTVEWFSPAQKQYLDFLYFCRAVFYDVLQNWIRMPFFKYASPSSR
ncbi:RAxF-45 family protein [Salsuginibacillus kocurii]